ncbi:ubiquitin carboxyl-terminal hydrolase isozyme L3 [Apiospora phragmitis]|uniref:Ubiquitin carboxyl-terminal hydrolase isozyme L3 n=1 Tax=Apiospora phragmitis TaxID=2905665 RepID=A0ABR1VDQ9_9PEZI
MPSASTTVAPRANSFATPPSANGHGGRKGPLPHIDDLTSVAVNLNPHTPLRKFLEVGDKHMRQAITYNDFRRPDLALQEFITAFTIAVDKIPKHKDYPSLKTGNGDLSRLYNALKSNITNHCATFDKIKDDIKEDNKRSGVLPRKGSDSAALSTLPNVPSAVPSHMRSSSANGIQSRGLGQTSQVADKQSVPVGKSKPAVQPKPQALHGNAIGSSVKPGSQELLNRFARLRDLQVPSSGSPTSSPSVNAGADQRHLPKIDSALPSMPKLPDAIYSPARGTVSSETANLPSSTPRGMFSRTNSINSVPSSARNSIDVPIRPTISEVFVPAHALGEGKPSTSTTTKAYISDSETITSEELKNYMSHGSAAIRLLLMDVRSREEYDEGHIFAQTSICIEPSVLARGGVSASEIEDSLGIAPDEEMQAFESRAQFDLVVFYDQSSSSIPKRPSDVSEEMALYTLYQALVHFDYPIKLRRPPKLLDGGINGWVDLFGSQSLRESKTNTVAAQPLHPRPLRASKTGVKTLAADEIKTWKEAAARNQVDYVTSTNDFLRRFPAIGEHQESMSSDYNGAASHNHQLRGSNAFENELPPAPPARPAPALPRTSYSGVSSREPASDVIFAKSARAAAPDSKPTGLVNINNKCYANSLIQCLLASPGFAAEFTDKDWPANWAPGKGNDPQLMARILGNLLQWLCGRQFATLKPTTLLNYSQSRHSGYKTPDGSTIRFGDRHQHDPSEYLDFIFLQLAEETNRVRDILTPAADYLQPRESYKKRKEAVPSTSRLIEDSWTAWCAGNQSILDRYWRLGTLDTTKCKYDGCDEVTEAFSWSYHLTVPLHPPGQDMKDAGPGNLENLLKEGPFKPEDLNVDEGFDCGPKKGPLHTSKTQTRHITRLPQLLCLRLTREASQSRKTLREVEFEVDDLDLTPHLSPEFGRTTNLSDEDGFSVKPIYDLYGVISHRGNSLSAGHYISYVRQGPTHTWFECNDEVVTERPLEELRRAWFNRSTHFDPLMLFYKRKDVAWKYATPPEGMQ